MQGYTESMLRLVEAFAKMPGIGRKTAERLTYYVLRAPREEMLQLADSIRDVKETVRHCSQCHNITERDPCSICSDARRDQGVICVVEEPKDLFAVEASGDFRGVYHVLMGRIAPLDDVGPEALTIPSLLDRAKSGTVKEVILATNPNLEGDGTALYLAGELSALGVRVTRLARGLATGSSIEHANAAILGDALRNRREM
jgi:recombination protein RecR